MLSIQDTDNNNNLIFLKRNPLTWLCGTILMALILFPCLFTPVTLTLYLLLTAPLFKSHSCTELLAVQLNRPYFLCQSNVTTLLVSFWVNTVSTLAWLTEYTRIFPLVVPKARQYCSGSLIDFRRAAFCGV